MHVNLEGKNQGKHKLSVKSNPASVTTKIWGESEYYLDLENEDKKQYKEKSTLSNGQLLSYPNVSITLLLG